MKMWVLIAALAGAVYYAVLPAPGVTDNAAPLSSEPAVAQRDDAAGLERAYVDRLSNQQLEGEGTVIKLLPDDHHGSRHQRFIVRLSSGRTLLIAHNIDLAKRIDTLREGDTVRFYGEYEWNQKGGVMHWTHHDPQGRHPGGWIKHGGQTYQ